MRERVAQKPTTQMRRMGAKDPTAIPSAASTFGAGRDSQETAQDAALKQSIQDRARDRLRERADVDQKCQNRENRKRRGELLPGVQAFPPPNQRVRRPWRLLLQLRRRLLLAAGLCPLDDLVEEGD